ncbi:hypothetical protein ACFOD0_11580 [Shewanella intestini]|uniref:Outer membrane cytochrome MtrC/MtrF-like domain-containing protein n=1 Tax=Shewanella intestini TaxID=2017544 RepID=A0ABS5I348_9GAMM|nr:MULTISPECIES: hypothetical protein [Shewanella]MBR9728424.1 hypothetical protein [Shewanella intestini]MRG36766.1 hypothetical protein [Shewanella sp. XMDDZSB0408]
MSKNNGYSIAFLVSAVLGLSACNGDDGKPGAPWEPPVVTTSAVAKVIDWHYGEGTVNVEFSVENQDGIAIEDLDRVQLFSTLTNDLGLLADTVDVTFFEGQDSSTGTLTHQGNGIYELQMPQEQATAQSIGVGYIRPGNGNNGMPRTKRIMFSETTQYAQVKTTDDAKCVACHGEFTAASGNAAWGWHQHHHALDNDQNIVIVDACLTCHTHTEKQDGGWAENTLAMIGHGKMADGTGGKVSKGHSALWSNYSMDMKRCSTCHIDDVEFTASINGCVTCHSDLKNPEREGHNHSAYDDESCASCHAKGEFKYYEHNNGKARDEALNRYAFELVSVARSTDLANIHVTVKATDANGTTVDIAAITDASPRGWATVMVNGEAMLPGRDAGHVARSTGGVTNTDGTYTYVIEHAIAHVEGEVLTGGVDGRIAYADGNAPISVSNIKDVRRTSSDGMKCLSCHTEGLKGHGDQRGGFDLGGDACTQCHSAFNWETDKAGKDYPMAWGPFVHNMHFGEYNQDRDLNNMPTTDRNKLVECTACHTGDIDLANVSPAVVLNGVDEANVYGITAITANCATCHTGDAAKNHMKQQGGDFNVIVTPTGMHQGESGDFAIFNPEPIVESCSVCHSPAKMAEAHSYVN